MQVCNRKTGTDRRGPDRKQATSLSSPATSLAVSLPSRPMGERIQGAEEHQDMPFLRKHSAAGSSLAHLSFGSLILRSDVDDRTRRTRHASFLAKPEHTLTEINLSLGSVTAWGQRLPLCVSLLAGARRVNMCLRHVMIPPATRSLLADCLTWLVDVRTEETLARPTVFDETIQRCKYLFQKKHTRRRSYFRLVRDSIVGF